MIKISMPSPDLVLRKNDQKGQPGEIDIISKYGFTDYLKIPRDKGGVFMFYNLNDELLFVGKARKLRLRIKKHFEDNVSAVKDHRDEIAEIAICYVEDPVEREIYETYAINKEKAKYNVDKVFFN
ncbi:nucleotide excision repair endonuclease [Metabacillus sp. KIGAM252]|uniref:Nucleotide excision repair endonuclease n=1 Tax=Metabacillus flavus TaxID=2823519 RepID=A0ABS5LF09_9BACI|nr:nucleotide excision repair endonuclease [Metabacillus flavus]MBS2969173.1 nucleotide excision repair endonuclease [Metabacillus flavus]